MDKQIILNELNNFFVDDISEKIVEKVIFTPKTNEKLRKAVDKWCYYKEEARTKYGEISDWDTSLITDMSELFKNKYNFNDDISNWNVSNVTNENMSSMFKFAYKFNHPLNNWNVSNVKDMNGMFNEAMSFNQHLNNWNVINVKFMQNMFTNSRISESPENYFRIDKDCNYFYLN